MSATLPPPWYKSPWPWFLMSIPALAVVGGIAMVVLAITSNDGLVTDDYYKEGQAINETLGRDHAAAALGLSAQVMLADDLRSIRILFDKPVKGPLTLHVLHPTREGQDQHVTLQQQGPQLYAAILPRPLEQPRWNVELADGNHTWRLTGVWKLDSPTPLQLTPER
ncbi:FixH family protein [Chitiniphilus eburneus]|uniref:Nitrogen fixation protein FixH n=1 Tax=Chitiniphilus eburneus TaxID=2571148 RepID=A0A4U0PY48_9NEIS|nr:FixH family protein [Chitiniphilus eburneus]TJZ73533.1 nitrogen fixation protein FixH [Chitiniphilus eburneus]